MNENLDRLYELLPAVYRIRDFEHGEPLRALLQVIAEQVTLVEQDIGQLYENWFVETAQDWAVPYIGELIGYRPIHDAGEPGNPTTPQLEARNKILIPRGEVANTIRYRRRKGTLYLLELLANDVAGWRARAVEFYRLLGWTQNINHPQLERDGNAYAETVPFPTRARTANLRNTLALDALDGPFDTLAHSVDVRRINSKQTRGRYNIPSVGVFVWRLKAYVVTATNAREAGKGQWQFSSLGNDAPLFSKPVSETDQTTLAGEQNVPQPITRRALKAAKDQYYGADKSVEIFIQRQDDTDPEYFSAVESGRLIIADLRDWKYKPKPISEFTDQEREQWNYPEGFIAFDPERGRIAFATGEEPEQVRVTYHYGFSADMGGGEYEHSMREHTGTELYRVGPHEKLVTIQAALQKWQKESPGDAVIELTTSRVYDFDTGDELRVYAGKRLQIRAAQHTRAVVMLENSERKDDPWRIALAPSSQLILDGLMIAGNELRIESLSGQAPSDKPDESECLPEIHIRHCTLVPGWSLRPNCEPVSDKPSISLHHIRVRMQITHSIVGAISVTADEAQTDPSLIQIQDSILDAPDPDANNYALSAPDTTHRAFVILTIKRSTVFGLLEVHAVELAENCIFNDCISIARRQLGCMRFCYVPPGCRTPRRYHCQPDLAEPNRQEQVRPRFTTRRYGLSGYGQLAETCADEIKHGADDEAEMGAFHDLFQPQRETNLRVRLAEYTPAGMNVGIIFVT